MIKNARCYHDDDDELHFLIDNFDLSQKIWGSKPNIQEKKPH